MEDSEELIAEFEKKFDKHDPKPVYAKDLTYETEEEVTPQNKKQKKSVTESTKTNKEADKDKAPLPKDDNGAASTNDKSKDVILKTLDKSKENGNIDKKHTDKSDNPNGHDGPKENLALKEKEKEKEASQILLSLKSKNDNTVINPKDKEIKKQFLCPICNKDMLYP